MLKSKKFAETFQEGIKEIKHFLNLQKRYIALDAADKIIVILSTVAIAAICIILLSMILFFTSFALAFWIGKLTHSLTLGFFTIAAGILLILITFYHKRSEWIVQPIARMIINLFNNKEEEQNG